MINKNFEVYKLSRSFKRDGNDFVFYRKTANEFGEPGTEQSQVAAIRGIYHEQNGSISISTNDTVQTRTKKIPMILCLYDDTVKLLNVGDFVIINEKKFSVTGIVDIQEWKLIADISLEVFDNGHQV